MKSLILALATIALSTSAFAAEVCETVINNHPVTFAANPQTAEMKLSSGGLSPEMGQLQVSVASPISTEQLNAIDGDISGVTVGLVRNEIGSIVRYAAVSAGPASPGIPVGIFVFKNLSGEVVRRVGVMFNIYGICK